MKHTAPARTTPRASSFRASSIAPISGGASQHGVPELPETETIARDLDRAIAGSTITDVRIRRGDVLREVNARQLTRRVVGSAIDRAWRRAKLIVLDLSTSYRIVVQ